MMPKCLLVDDRPENLVALKAILEGEQVQVFSSNSGLEALELMLDHDFALALVDIQMPEMDGFELAEIMRGTDKTRSVPIIFVTADSTSSQKIFRGYEAGAVDFLHKPLTPQVVVSKIRIFLELYNQRFELISKIRELQETEAGLQRALLSRDEFLSICSHELKTPLTSLKMQLQIIDRIRVVQGDEVAFSVKRMEKYLVSADRSIERIVHLVDDMLDISRVATGKLTFNLERVNMKDLITEVLERISAFMDYSHCPVTVTEMDDCFCEVDKFRIEQVLTNIFNNATKYAPGCAVEIQLKKKDQEVEIKITDHGEGISEIDQARIFERFERAVSPNSVSGLGLGLYISREIIEMHGGRIRVQSTRSEGSTFIISLPSV